MKTTNPRREKIYFNRANVDYSLSGGIMMKTKGDNNGIVTLEKLTTAIKIGVYHRPMKDEEAKRLAQHVLNFFGYQERIIDNMLEPEDRDAFYMLEDSGILMTSGEETTLYDGREWRIHYWLLRKDRIEELLRSTTEETPQKVKPMIEEDVYKELPDDIWAAREVVPDNKIIATK